MWMIFIVIRFIIVIISYFKKALSINLYKYNNLL